MKALHRFRSAFGSAILLTPAALLAHPGHDGDHDFTWDFSHLAAHPVATLFCGLVIGAAIWAFIRARRSDKTKHE